MKRVWTIHGEYIVWPIILALLGWFFWWLAFVPNDDTRAISCPRREKLIDLYGGVEADRPLKAYEQRRLADHRRYVESWCQ